MAASNTTAASAAGLGAASSALHAAVDFEALNAQLDEERVVGELLRERTKQLESSVRHLSALLNGMHACPATQLRDRVVSPAANSFGAVREQVKALEQGVPEGRYYQWHNLFDYSIRNLCASAILTYYLGTAQLLDKHAAEQALGISPNSTRLQLATEDYLHALISTLSELSRLAVTSVTVGDVGTPRVLSRFVKDLHAGFQLLNLKNNDLRKRFDGVKYDVKKIEEVVYDISLRGLLKDVAGSDGSGSVPGLRDDYPPEQVSEVRRQLLGAASV